VNAQNDINSSVNIALLKSEKALYKADFLKAKEIIQLANYNTLKRFDKSHEIALTLQSIRIENFKSIVLNLKSDPIKTLERLNTLLKPTKLLHDKNIKGDYFLALSAAYQSIREIDSALIYRDKATQLFLDNNNFGKIAIIRSSNISRIHNSLFHEGKKSEILELIPEYKIEIKFSSIHSKYALAYNTRHLAQIYRRQTQNYQESLKLFKTSLFLRKAIKFKIFLPASYSSIGDVYLKLEAYASAIRMYKKASKLAISIGFVRYQSYPHEKIGDIYLIKGNTEKALRHYKLALKYASKNNYIIGISNAKEKLKTSIK
jgi:tetratricopeptide (TPR) repeat protein